MSNGIKEEIQVANLFSKLDYLTRFHTQILIEKGPVSDIDVFCVKFNNHLSSEKIIIETKRNQQKSSSIFQLFGLKEYYKNADAYFITNKINRKLVKIASELNIKLYTFERLKKLVSNDLNNNNNIEYSISEGKTVINYLKDIKSNISEEMFWEYHDIWLENDPLRKLMIITEIFELTDQEYSKYENRNSFLWFRKELFILSFIAILEIASTEISLNNEQIKGDIKDRFYNMGISKKRKIRLERGILGLINFIKKHHPNEIQDFDFSIIPKWVIPLEKLIVELIEEAPNANKYLLINENVLRANLFDKETHISKLTTSMEYSKISEINEIIIKILHESAVRKDFNCFI